MKKKDRSLNVYFAGELFNLKHLIGNAYLAEAIYEKSHGRYLCALPQDYNSRGTAPRSIRDHHSNRAPFYPHSEASEILIRICVHPRIKWTGC